MRFVAGLFTRKQNDRFAQTMEEREEKEEEEEEEEEEEKRTRTKVLRIRVIQSILHYANGTNRTELNKQDILFHLTLAA